MLIYKNLKKMLIFLIVTFSFPFISSAENPDIAYNDMGFVKIKRTQKYVEVEIDYGSLAYNISYNKKNETSVTMQDFEKSEAIGEPDLPRKILRLGMPPNVIRESINFQIIDQHITDLGADLYIPPVLAPRKAANVDETTSFNEGGVSEKNQSIYNNDAFYPSVPVRISPLSNIKDWIFISVELYPFQYNPKNGKLQKIDVIKCRIQYDTDGLVPDYSNIKDVLYFPKDSILKSNKYGRNSNMNDQLRF
jgi:hypothetical protein